MKLADALPPDGQSIVTEFLGALISTDSNLRDCGKKVDVSRFMVEYRNAYKTFASENMQGMPESEKKKRRQKKLDSRQYMSDHNGEPLSVVAAGLGMSSQSISKWYRELGIKRTSWVGRSAEAKGRERH